MREWAGVLVAGLALSAGAQVPSGQVPVAPSRTNIKTDAELDAEAKQADALYQQNRAIDTLAMYEDLHAQRPDRMFYTARLAMAWIMKGGATNAPEEKEADRARARKLLMEVQASGQKSDLVDIELGLLNDSAAAAKAGAAPPRAAGQDTLDQAEVLFSKGDLRGSMELYTKAWRENPKLYSAPLFAGDAEYKQDHYDAAGVWFQRAIAIDPDRETAYRYWADDLTKAGRPAEARKEFVEALVAEPYGLAPRAVLKTWATSHGLRYLPPPVVIPIALTRGKDAGYTMNVDPARIQDQNYMAWVGYPMQTLAWQKDKFARAFPGEKTYRHSLAEEVEGLRMLLTVVRNNKKLPPEQYDATIRSLMELEKDGMLECWILLDNPDQGVAQDYAAYRAGHRELLKAYVEKYDLHPA